MDNNSSNILRGVGIHVPPYFYANKDGSFSGLGYNLFNSIAASLNMRSQVFLAHDKVPGMPGPTGNWTGIIGTLQRGESDMALLLLLPTYHRSQVAKLSPIVFETFFNIMGSAPPPSTMDISGLILVFDKEIWIGLLISMVLMILVSGIITPSTTSGGFRLKFSSQEYYTLISYYISTLFQEGTPRNPSSGHGKFLFGIWWLVILVLSNGFCGLLRSVMMRPKEGLKVQSLQHLATMTDKIQPYTWKGSGFEEYFRTGFSVNQKIILNALDKGNGLRTLNELYSPEILLQVEKGKAVIMNNKLMSELSLRKNCGDRSIGHFYYAKEPVQKVIAVMYYRKDLDPKLASDVNKRINWLFEAHLCEKWINDEIDYLPLCKTTVERDDSQPLGLDDLGGIFKMLFVLQACTFVDLILELVWFYGKRFIDKKKQLLVQNST